ncbi:LPXTG cell wall anchor domain-containing protein [Bifidobacterium asteroides]|uniref:LPXTG cell wall anchor domain-containing protein n=1 Tax=Bifidobacterium asteroides TaxID=1684 RepID=UPI003A80E809
MHMQRDNEGIRLPKLLGLAVAGATLLAGMVVLPATQASAADAYGFAAEDDFVAGDLDTAKVPQLTVTKYLSLNDGYAPTGSANDAVQLNSNHDLAPAKDILFNVREVQPADGKSLADINANEPTSYTYKNNTIYAGVTNGQGVINDWYQGDTSGKPTDTKLTFPAGPNHYYILSENTAGSYAFDPSNPNGIDQTKYKTAVNSFFGLPYATNGSDAQQTRGFIYHLHLYPKNVNAQSFAKTVQSVKDADGNVKDQTTATAGDTVTYKLSQKIYNEGTAASNDGKLDVKELKGQGTDVRLADRMSSSLRGNPATIKADIRDSNGNKLVDLAKTDDYTQDLATNANPARLNDTSKKMFADAPSDDVTYWVFDFFTTAGASKVQTNAATSVMELEVTYDALVTGNGDSTGTGGVVNDAASDFSENKGSDGKGKDPVPSHTNVTNAALAFGSVQSKKLGYPALPDTEYRLVKDADSTDKYLASDGKFYGSKDTVPSNVQVYKATANKKGLVVFAALPIFGTGESKAADKTVQNTSWMLVETKTPQGWRNPGIPFGKVTYGDVGMTEEGIVQKYGRNATLQPNYDALNFGNFDAPVGEIGTETKLMFNNVAVSKYLAHYKTTDGDSPLALPLTGGRGILLLLVVGALIMGGALYARNRRNNAVRA